VAGLGAGGYRLCHVLLKLHCRRALLGIGVAILVYNAILWVILGSVCVISPLVTAFEHLAKLQIGWTGGDDAADPLSGGVESPLFSIFLSHCSASILLSSGATYCLRAGDLSVGGTGDPEYAAFCRTFRCWPGPPGLYRHGVRGGVLVFFASTMFVIAYLATARQPLAQTPGASRRAKPTLAARVQPVTGTVRRCAGGQFDARPAAGAGSAGQGNG